MALISVLKINSDDRAVKRAGEVTQAAFLVTLQGNYPAGGELLDLSAVFRTAYASAGLAFFPNPGNPTTGALAIGLERAGDAMYRVRAFDVGAPGVLTELAAGPYPIAVAFEVLAIGVPSTDLG